MINPYSSLVHTCVVYILTPVTAMPIYHRIPLIPTISILCTKIDFETAPVTSCTGQQNFPPSCNFPSFQNLARDLAARQDLPVSDPLLVFSDKCLGQELMPAFAVLPQKSRLCPLSCGRASVSWSDIQPLLFLRRLNGFEETPGGSEQIMKRNLSTLSLKIFNSLDRCELLPVWRLKSRPR